MTDKSAMTPLDGSEMDTLFAAARGAGPFPSSDLLGRIAADADAVLAAAGTAPDSGPETAPLPGWRRRLLTAIGGWPSAAGLAAAAVTGLTIGIAAPGALESLSGGYLTSDGYALENLVVSYAGLLEEDG